ncbi:hypothetical protein A2U01_0034149, partial [Trifolium medium]|nr:hypothetical protein [Trifolium medium]
FGLAGPSPARWPSGHAAAPPCRISVVVSADGCDVLMIKRNLVVLLAPLACSWLSVYDGGVL